MKKTKIKRVLFITSLTSSVAAVAISTPIIYNNNKDHIIDIKNNEILGEETNSLLNNQTKSKNTFQRVVYNQVNLKDSEIIPNVSTTQNDEWLNSVRTTITTNPTFTYIDANSEDQIRKQIWSLIDIGTNFQTLDESFTSQQLKQNSTFTISNLSSSINGFVHFSISINTNIKDSSNNSIVPTISNGLKSNGIIGFSGFKLLEQTSPTLSSFQINMKQADSSGITLANGELAYQLVIDPNNNDNQQLSNTLKSFIQQNWIYIFDITNGQLSSLDQLFNSINIYAPIDIQKDSIRFRVLFMNKVQNGEIIPAQKTVYVTGVLSNETNASAFGINEIIGISLCLGGGVLLLIAMLIVLIKKAKKTEDTSEEQKHIPDDLTGYIVPDEIQDSNLIVNHDEDPEVIDKKYYLDDNYEIDSGTFKNKDNKYLENIEAVAKE